MVKFIDSDSTENLYYLDTAGTQLYKRVAGTYADNGAAIEAWVTSKAQDLGNPDLTKYWVDLRLIFRRITGLMTLTLYSDDDSAIGTATIGTGSARGMGMNMLGSFALGKDGETTVATSSFVDNPLSVDINQDSRTIKFKVYNNRVNENFVLLGMIYAYYPKSHYVIDSSRKVYI
jgi:hypothetical protein